MMLLWPLHAHTSAEIKGRFPNADFSERDAQNNMEKVSDNLYFTGDEAIQNTIRFGSWQLRWWTVLEIPPVDSPKTAVKMAIYSDIKKGKK